MLIMLEKIESLCKRYELIFKLNYLTSNTGGLFKLKAMHSTVTFSFYYPELETKLFMPFMNSITRIILHTQ